MVAEKDAGFTSADDAKSRSTWFHLRSTAQRKESSGDLAVDELD